MGGACYKALFIENLIGQGIWFLLQRRFCMELNKSTLEAGAEKLFKQINEEFDSIGKLW